jgi:hypothetical protein
MNKFGVTDSHAHAERHRHAVAGHRRRVRGRCKHLAVTTACNDHSARRDRSDRRHPTVGIDSSDPDAGNLADSIDRLTHHEIQADHHRDTRPDR